MKTAAPAMKRAGGGAIVNIASISGQTGFHAIQTDHVEFITGKKPYSLREVFEFCKGRSYDDC